MKTVTMVGLSTGMVTLIGITAQCMDIASTRRQARLRIPDRAQAILPHPNPITAADLAEDVDRSEASP